MAVTEQVDVSIEDGRQEEFEAAVAEAVTILKGAPGCGGATLRRGIERPTAFLLLIEWESVEAHVAFTTSPEMATFGGLIRPFFAGPPTVEHFGPPAFSAQW